MTGANAYFCPLCGGVLRKTRGENVFHISTQLFYDEDLLLEGCLCHFTYPLLEKIYSAFDDRLRQQLTDYFPKQPRKEIMLALRKMDRNSPVRAIFLKKLSILDRAKERLAKLRVAFDKEAEMEKQNIAKKASLGEKMSISDWFRSVETRVDQKTPSLEEREKQMKILDGSGEEDPLAKKSGWRSEDWRKKQKF